MTGTVDIQTVQDAIASNMKLKGTNWSTTTWPTDDNIEHNNCYELELKNGKRIVLKLSKTFISDIIGSFKYEIHLTKTFPFITLQKQHYTTFTYNQTTYTVKVSLPKFMELVGIPYTSYDEIRLTDIIENG